MAYPISSLRNQPTVGLYQVLILTTLLLGLAQNASGQETPTVSIAPPTLAAGDGGHLFEIEGDPDVAENVPGGAWVLTRTGDGAGELTVNVTVTEPAKVEDADGDFVPAANEGAQTVTFADGETTATYRPIEDDGAKEDNGTVTVALATGAGYAVDDTDNSATVAVRDDDERMEFTIDPLDLTVVEGEDAQFHAVLRTTDTDTFTESGDVARVLRARSGLTPGRTAPYPLSWLTEAIETVAPADHETSSRQFSIAASQFAADGDGYAARHELESIGTSTDTDDEGPERFIARLLYVPGSETSIAVPATRANIPDLLDGSDVVELDGTNFIAAVVTITNLAPPSISIAGPSIAAGDGGHLFEIEGDPGSAAEVSGGAWALTRTGDGVGELTVNVTVTEPAKVEDADGDFVPAANEGAQTVTFADGETTATYRPIEDDDSREDNGTVTVALATGAGYVVDDTDNSATVAVRDDDERMEFTIDPLDLTVVEGEDAQFHAVLRTTDTDTFTESGDVARVMRARSGLTPGRTAPYPLTWFTQPIETVAPADHEAVSKEVSITASQFVANGDGYAARHELESIGTFTDTDDEGPERFIASLHYHAGSDPSIAVPATRANIPDLLDGSDVVELDGTNFIAAVVTITNLAPPSISIAGPSLAAGDDGHLFEIEGDPGSAAEVSGGAWVLTRTGDTETELDVEVMVSETGSDFVPAANEGAQTVTFTDGETTATYRPIEDDDSREDNGTVTVALATGAGYVVDDTDNSATVAVRDDDERMEFTIDPLDLTVVEGEDAQFHAVLRTTDTDTFTESGDVARVMRMRGGSSPGRTVPYPLSWLTEPIETVEPADHEAVSKEVSITASQFAADSDGYAARHELESIGTFTDPDGEDPERFIASLRYDDDSERSIAVPATRENIPDLQKNGDVVELSGSDFITAVVTINDVPPLPGEQCAGSEDEIRLVDGGDEKEGRVEICADDDTGDHTPARWGTVCDDYWTNDEADVACMALGYERSEPDAGRFLRSRFGAGTGPIWLDDMLCRGDETSLLDCPLAGGRTARDAIGAHNCKSSEVVGVRCMAAGDERTLTVADATVEEGAQLVFQVSLNEAADWGVTVNYQTRNGTATAGLDYEEVNGTLTFAAGETEKTVTVVTLDDSVDDGGETLILHLRHASGARIESAKATGTIHNSDPLPKGWLSRFGRTSASHVVDMLGARFDEAGRADNRFTLGGHTMDLRSSFRRAPESGDTMARATDDTVSRLMPGQSRYDAQEGQTSEATPLEHAIWNLLTNSNLQSDTRRFLSGSSFDLSLSDSSPADLERGQAPVETITAVPESPGHWSLWGRGALTQFSGQDTGVNINGDVLTGLLGVDYARNRWLAGMALAYHDGNGSYTSTRNAGTGDLDSTLVSVNPYLRYALTERLSVWGTLGYGTGRLELRQELRGQSKNSDEFLTPTPSVGAGYDTRGQSNITPDLAGGHDNEDVTLTPALVPGEVIETDMSLTMGALGLRGVVYASASTELALKTDALWVRTSSDETDGMQDASADVSRIRLLLAGRHQRVMANDAMLSPSFELGVRYDDGDAETGFGMELGGGLRYTDALLGLTVETKARALLAHEDGGYEEWGVGGSLSLDPGRLGRGLALRLDSGWGLAESGAQALWQRQTTAGIAPQHDIAAQGRVIAELGYGLDVPWTYSILTPYSGMEWTGAHRTLRLGWRYTLGRQLSLSLDGERREDGHTPPEYALMLRTVLPW